MNYLSLLIEAKFNKKFLKSIVYAFFMAFSYIYAYIALDKLSSNYESDFIISIASIFALVGYYFIHYMMKRLIFR